MSLNPYQTQFETKIIKKLTPKGKTHLALEDNISFDYEKLNTFVEPIMINGQPIEGSYKSSLGKVYILSKPIDADFVTLSVDYDLRMTLLKSLTFRYLILAFFKKHYHLSAKNFRTEKNISSFELPASITEDELVSMVSYLELALDNYISSAIEIQTNLVDKIWQTDIPGVYHGQSLGPTLSNLSQLGPFDFAYYKKDKRWTLYYRV